ncbi:MAG TPA: hypothetical protein VMJ32_00550 [Pirellulales bacterium]|nr:hypothetical protein [Pirellulales bacterium]
MSPYTSLFSNPTDIIIVLVLVNVWLIFGVTTLRSRQVQRGCVTVGYCWACARALIWLCTAIAAIFIFGLIFLEWLHVKSGLWTFYELFWFFGVIAVFRLLPFYCVGILCWCLVLKARGITNRDTILSTIALLIALAIDALLYFAVEVISKSQIA